jgi:hypothetical protein
VLKNVRNATVITWRYKRGRKKAEEQLQEYEMLLIQAIQCNYYERKYIEIPISVCETSNVSQLHNVEFNQPSHTSNGSERLVILASI